MTTAKRFSPLAFLFILAFLAACSYTLSIKDGRTAYERKRFATAIPMLEQEYNRAKTRSDKGQLAYLLADAYRRTGRDAESLPWFKTAYDNNYGAEALKAYAYELKKLERYAEAAATFKELGIEIGSPYEFRKEITATTIAQDWLKQAPQSGWTVEPAPFNSPQNDFSPAFFNDGRLVFTSDRAMSTGEDAYRWTNNKFMDLFIVEPTDASAQPFEGTLNSERNEGVACFNRDFTQVYFTRAMEAYKGDDAFCKIYFAQKEADGSWGAAQPLPFQKERIDYRHPAISTDGNTLYFASNDPEGWGGYDLYSVQRSTKTESGWDDAPKLLSRSLNTPGNELFPTLDADTLYFASDGLTGMGGLDIFRTHKSERNAWSPPQNLKAPVNSGADDFGLTVDGRGVKVERGGTKVEGAPSTVNGQKSTVLKAGYFTSNRPNGRGGDDIYRFEQRVPPPKPPKVDTLPAKPLVYKMLLEGYVLEKIYSVAGDPNSKVLGRKPLEGAMVQIDAGGKKQTVTVKEDGFFNLTLNDNTDYNFTANRTGYLTNSARFSTRGIAKDPDNPVQTYEVEIVLDKVYRDREIVLENIYYDYDKWDIRPDAEPTLNRLAEVLRQNPDVRIQLGSHTDCRGNDAYNEDLSQKRAQSAVNYLISKGIDPARLAARGYGESRPAADCACARCSEAEHQTNRRTTFQVVE